MVEFHRGSRKKDLKYIKKFPKLLEVVIWLMKNYHDATIKVYKYPNFILSQSILKCIYSRT